MSEVSSVTLLQDVAFRIQESKHLDSEQKREYSNILSDEIEKEKEKEERTPLPNITARIEDIIKSTEDNEVAEELQKLKEEIEEASYQTVWNSKDGMKYMFDADEDIVDGMGNKKFQDTRLLPYILMIIVYTTGTYLLLRLIGF